MHPVTRFEALCISHGIIERAERERSQGTMVQGENMRLRWFMLGVLIGIALMLLADAIDARQRGEL